MNLFDFIDIFLQPNLLIDSADDSRNREELKSDIMINVLSGLFLFSGAIISVLEINKGYAVGNIYIVLAISIGINLILSIGASILLNQIFSITYSFKNLTLFLISLSILLNSVTFLVNRMNNQILFKIEIRQKSANKV